LTGRFSPIKIFLQKLDNRFFCGNIGSIKTETIMSKNKIYRTKTAADKVCKLTDRRDIDIKYKKNGENEMFLFVRYVLNGRFSIPIAVVMKSADNYIGAGLFWGVSKHELRWAFSHLEVETQANCRKQREDYLHNAKQNLIAAQSSVKGMVSATLGKVA
jgi:hypothetical protein